MMEKVFEISDKGGRRIYLTKERLGHIIKHPDVSEHVENIKEILKRPYAFRRHEVDKDARYYYGYFKDRDPSERYLLILVRYLNSSGFIITAFFTNKIEGLK